MEMTDVLCLLACAKNPNGHLPVLLLNTANAARIIAKSPRGIEIPRVSGRKFKVAEAKAITAVEGATQLQEPFTGSISNGKSLKTWPVS